MTGTGRKRQNFLCLGNWHSSANVSKCENSPTFTMCQPGPLQNGIGPGWHSAEISSTLSPTCSAAEESRVGEHTKMEAMWLWTSKNSHYLEEYVNNYASLWSWMHEKKEAINNKREEEGPGLTPHALKEAPWALGWRHSCMCSKAPASLNP